MYTRTNMLTRYYTSIVLVLSAASFAQYSLQVSTSPNRTNSVPLQGQTVSGQIYVFVDPQTGIDQVAFYVDDPSMQGQPYLVEKRAPYDLAGTGGGGAAKPFDTSQLSGGSHTITALITLTSGSDELISAAFSVPSGTGGYALMLSTSANRSGAVPLDGQTVPDTIYVFTGPDTGVSRVRFFLDDPSMIGPPRQTENTAPYDFAGTASNGNALPFDTTQLSNGLHTITASMTLSAGGAETIHADFFVGSTAVTYQLLMSTSPNRSAPVALAGQIVPDTIYVFTSPDTDVTGVSFFLDDPSMSGAPWLTEIGAPFDFAGTNTDGTANPFDTTSLSSGLHTITASVTLGTGGTQVISANFNVGGTSIYTLLVSQSSNRANPVPLSGQTESGSIFVFVSPQTNITQVRFFLDDPSMIALPRQVENGAPYDFAGTASNGTAVAFDTSQIPDGQHTITAAIDVAGGGTETTSSVFTTDNGVAAVNYDQVHVSWAADPAATLTVIWRTYDVTTASTVQYRQAGQTTWQTATGALRSSGTGGTLHEVTLTSLLASTTYEYRVRGDNSVWSEIFQARMAPTTFGPGDFDVIYFADTGLIGRIDGLATGTEQVVDEIALLRPRLILAGGDYIYFNTDKRYSTLNNSIDVWFNQVQPFAAYSAMMPTFGNHEILLSEGYNTWTTRFARPDGFKSGRFYSFDVADVHFISILTVSDVDGLLADELAWIEQDIQAALTAGQRWIIPFMHVSAFGDGTNHPSNANLRAQLGPLFEQYSIRLVLASQDQAYERSYPLVDVPATNTPTSTSLICYGPTDGVVWAKISPAGKLSNISGGFSPFATEPPPAWTAVRDNTLHHFARLSFTGDGTLYFEAFGVVGDGTPPVVLDAFAYNLDTTCPDQLLFDTPQVQFTLGENQGDSAIVNLATSDNSAVNYSLSENAPWLTVTKGSSQTPSAVTVAVNTTGLTAGPYQAVVTATASGYDPAELIVSLNVASNDYTLMLSQQSDRTNPVPLAGQTVTNLIYVFIAPETNIDHVAFYLDDPSMAGPPQQIENNGPYDFAGTLSNGKAKPYDTDNIADGIHTITAEIFQAGGGSVVVSDDFVVDNVADTQALVFVPGSQSFTQNPDTVSSPAQVTLQANDGAQTAFAISNIPAWLTVDPTNGQTPANISLTADSTGLGVGSYSQTLFADSGAYDTGSLDVTLNVLDGSGCSPLPCSEILVTLPYILTFAQNHGKILDKNDVGTGFTYIDKPTNGVGYIPGNIEIAAGRLRLTTTAGIQYLGNNTQDNALGVGIDVPSQISILSTTVVNPSIGTGKYEQAGLWFGTDEDNYIKATVQSRPTGTFVELLLEVGGLVAADISKSLSNLGSSSVGLKLTVDPQSQTITGGYKIGSGGETVLASYSPPPEFFSFDAAGINPEIGTRSFGGIFATNRNGPNPVVYEFEEFRVDEQPLVPVQQDLAFTRTSFSLPTPTSMVWGPDNKLYVLELFGKIHAVTFGPNKEVLQNQSITALQDDLGPRLALGITVDPASTPSNVILWVAHSSPSLDNGAPDSGMVTRLSGANFSTVNHVITGLPRAIANHGTNSIHFGPDGRLYIAQGGNTGAGAPNTSNSEFGDMEEQPLSAALLVADVYMNGFDGSCHNPTDIFGTPPCDVQVYSSGCRNIYDFVFHSNGQIYAPENGLGVTGTYPPSPLPPCFGFANTQTNNPGPQPDELLRLLQGKYYGHPNPYRNECVFKDGSYQGVAPLANFEPPMYILGDHKSADGMIEYNSDAFCGQLNGDLLIANYSVGDDITRIKLSPDGLSVESASSLIGGFNDPLPLAQGPDGTIYVGEFGGNKVTALIPQNIGCWSTRQSMPLNILDPAGAAVNGKLYAVAGKTSSSYLSTVYIYDPVANTWSSGPNKPGPGLEDVTVASHNGKLYAFGGATAPFSGAVTTAQVYDPGTSSWSALASMPSPRMGATAGVMNGLIYVAGGFDGSGSSVDTMFIYNPANNSWSTGPSMQTRRDHAGSAVLGGKFYVFGGRTRDANGTTVNPTLQSVEMFDPAAGTWVSRASMPTGRRTMVVGTLNGKAQLIGGENTPTGGAFEQNEEYDPTANSWRTLAPMLTPRHGAAGGTINGVVYVAGGGTVAGTSFSNIVEAFE